MNTTTEGSDKTNNADPNNVQFVLDGSSLLRRLRAPCRRGSTFDYILEAYVDFVNEHYPKSKSKFLMGTSQGRQQKTWLICAGPRGERKGCPFSSRHEAADFKKVLGER